MERATKFLDDGTFLDVFGQGTPIIFIHGLGCDHTIWNGFTHCAKHFQIIRYDLSGHGRTKARTKHLDFNIYINQLKTVCEYTRSLKPVIVGHSLGGVIAAIAATASSINPQKIVIISTPFNRDRLLLLGAQDRIKSIRRTGLNNYSQTLLKRWFPMHDFSSSMDLKRRIEDMILLNDQDSFLRAYRLALEGDALLQKLAPKVDCDAKLIYGQNDESAPVSGAKELHKCIYKSSLTELENAGHMLPIEVPDRLCNEILRFIG